MLEAEQNLLRQAASAALGRTRGVGAAEPELAPLLEQLEDMVRGCNFYLGDLTRAGMLTTKVRQLFAAQLGENPKRFLLRCRMEMATWLLCHTALPDWRIAQLLDFSQPRNFSRDYKRFTGRNPSTVRAEEASTAGGELPGKRRGLGLVLQAAMLELTPAAARRLSLDLARSIAAPVPAGAGAAEPLLVVAAGEEAAVWAERVWQAIAEMPLAEQEATVRGVVRFESPALFEHLGQLSRREGRRNRLRGVDLARLALASLEGCDEAAAAGLGRLQALGWARLANAQRLTGDFAAAETSFARAEEWRCETPASSEDVRVEAEIAFLRGSMRLFQRRFDEAVALLDRSIALWRVADDAYGEVKALLQRASLSGYQGDLAATIPDLQQALHKLAELDEPMLELSAWQNLTTAFALIEEPGRARIALAQAQALCAATEHPVVTWQLKWIEGLIATDRTAAAECFHAARIGFIDFGDMESAALVSLELAVVCHQEGRLTEALRLASEALPILASCQLEREVLAAQMLRQAVKANELSEELLRQIRDCLRRLTFVPS